VNQAYSALLGEGYFFFFSSRRRHTRSKRDWSSDVCSSDLGDPLADVTEQFTGTVEGTIKRRSIMAGFVPVRSVRGTSTISNRGRSEERRVGKECRCRGGAWP